jgi:competence protein ComGC
MFNKKGQIRIIEAFLAIAVIFSTLIISTLTFPSSPNLTKQRSLANLGMQALIKLDANGTLGKLIIQENWTAIKQSLDALLPTGVSFNLTIYDENSNQINSQVIQNTNLLGRETVSVQYICASRSQNIQFFILRLQLAWTR